MPVRNARNESWFLMGSVEAHQEERLAGRRTLHDGGIVGLPSLGIAWIWAASPVPSSTIRPSYSSSGSRLLGQRLVRMWPAMVARHCSQRTTRREKLTHHQCTFSIDIY
jgi:hypothetical protein